MANNAVDSSRVSRVIGYQLQKGSFQLNSPNLPQRIALLGEANTANQSGLSLTPVQLTSSTQAGNLFGFGSPLHIASRILLPLNGGGTAVPVWAYPQVAAGSSTARAQTVTVTGTATANTTHYVTVAGRNGIDGNTYAVGIVVGDTPTTAAAKVRDAINNVLSSPIAATATTGVVTATAKWTGLTSQGITITVDTGDNAAGLTYAVAQTVAGAGTPDIAPALALFNSDWNTIIINTYGAVTAVMDALEAFNGIPVQTAGGTPTGRYTGIIMKPSIAITGSTLDDPTTVTDGRLNNVTIAIAPAPLSPALAMEAAANMAVLFANVSQNNPHLDVAGQFYPDMPGPTGNPAMVSYAVRDSYVKKGSSTVDVLNKTYQVQDFVTTYHPIGEVPPQYRYPRNLMIDFNVRYGYYLLENTNVVDHAIAADADIVTASNVVKPKQWKQVLVQYSKDLATRALIAQPEFMQASLQVGISNTNPDRLETQFSYKRTGFDRINSTIATAGFNFGTA